MAYGYGKSFMLQQDMVECLQHDTGYINLLCGHAIKLTFCCAAVQVIQAWECSVISSLLLVAASSPSLPTFRSPTLSVPLPAFLSPPISVTVSVSLCVCVWHARTDSPCVSAAFCFSLVLGSTMPSAGNLHEFPI